MVGFKLGKTLSEEGAVSRGVCTTNSQMLLQNVVEHTQIERINGKVCFKDEHGNSVELDENLQVSMNFWGFSPDFYDYTEKLMVDFFSGSIGNAKAEFYIPTVVNKSIQEKIATCKVLSTNAEWFGVTYPGDRPVVVNRLSKLIEKGEYPSPLWNK